MRSSPEDRGRACLRVTVPACNVYGQIGRKLGERGYGHPFSAGSSGVHFSHTIYPLEFAHSRAQSHAVCPLGHVIELYLE